MLEQLRLQHLELSEVNCVAQLIQSRMQRNLQEGSPFLCADQSAFVRRCF